MNKNNVVGAFIEPLLLCDAAKVLTEKMVLRFLTVAVRVLHCVAAELNSNEVNGIELSDVTPVSRLQLVVYLQ